MKKIEDDLGVGDICRLISGADEFTNGPRIGEAVKIFKKKFSLLVCERLDGYRDKDGEGWPYFSEELEYDVFLNAIQDAKENT